MQRKGSLVNMWIWLGVLFVAAWLVATWWCADNEPVFGPKTKDRVTFKRVIRDAMCDLAEIFMALVAPPWVRSFVSRAWRWAGPKITNGGTWSALIAAGALAWETFANGPQGHEFLAQHPGLAFVAILIGLLATRQKGSLDRIPPEPATGPGAEAERAGFRLAQQTHMP